MHTPARSSEQALAASDLSLLVHGCHPDAWPSSLPLPPPAKDPNNGETALHKAAKNGHLTSCIVLMESGASTSVTNKQGKTPVRPLLAWDTLDCRSV